MKDARQIRVFLIGPVEALDHYLDAVSDLSGFVASIPSGHLRRDIQAITELDTITDRIGLLPDWQQQRHASFEVALAKRLRIECFEISISEAGRLCWRYLPDEEAPTVVPEWHRMYATRRGLGSPILLTEAEPVITTRNGTQIRDAWGKAGDNIDHQICPTFSRKLFGREFPILKPAKVMLAGVCID